MRLRAKAKARFAKNPEAARARAITRKAQLRTEAAAKIAVAAESRQAEVQETWEKSRSWSAGQKLPPAFACIQDQTCLAWLRERYEYFEQCSVKTCASCNERWFKVPTAPLSFGWKPQTSKMLSAPAGGPSFEDGDMDSGNTLCATCSNSATSEVLSPANGLGLGSGMPAPLAKLTDFEEMLVSRIHPLIQVFTLFPSGQIAYVGHIVNFRQRSIHWVQNLPLHPNDIPIILVRRKTREAAGVRRRRSPFAARKEALRDALHWLLAHHPQWQPGVHGDARLCEEIGGLIESCKIYIYIN